MKCTKQASQNYILDSKSIDIVYINSITSIKQRKWVDRNNLAPPNQILKWNLESHYRLNLPEEIQIPGVTLLQYNLSLEARASLRSLSVVLPNYSASNQQSQ